MANKSCSQLLDFPKFEDLPTEIRLRIWKFAIDDPRYIHIESERIVPVPGVLHACYESRHEALKSYSLIRIPRFPPGQPFSRTLLSKHEEFVNLVQDTICFFPPKTEHDGFYAHVHQTALGKILLHCEKFKVQNFATDHWMWRKVIFSLAFYHNQGYVVNPEQLPELSIASSIKTVALCPPFGSSSDDENDKIIVDFKEGGEISKAELERGIKSVIGYYNGMNPTRPWSWQGTVRYVSVEPAPYDKDQKSE